MVDRGAVVALEQSRGGSDKGEVDDHVGLLVQPGNRLSEERLLLRLRRGLHQGELGDHDLLVGELLVCVLDVRLELAEVRAVPCVLRK